MEREYIRGKIRELSNEKLIILLRKVHNVKNNDIYTIAIEEMDSRGLKFGLDTININNKPDEKLYDLRALDKWNWGAFLLAPTWALANNLKWWAILCFIPGVNFIVHFYLGQTGNRLSYHKSNINSVEDFLSIQDEWAFWGKLAFGLLLFILIVFLNL